MLSNCYKTIIRMAAPFAASCMAALMLASCEDDFRDESVLIPDGTGSLSLAMEFAPMAEGLTGSRAATAAAGDALNGIVDLCVLFYDKDGDLLDDYVYYYNKDAAKKPADLPENRFFSGAGRFKEVPRESSDASNGKLAQETSMSGSLDVIKVPYGQYYIVGVANLGNEVSDNCAKATTTYEELFDNPSNDPSTIGSLRSLRLKWDASKMANNAEMFGCFTDGQTSREAASFFSEASLPQVIVNRDGMQLKSWLRRAASKVTIAFDGTDLRDNIWIHLKSATIKDIPAGCDLGLTSRVTKTDSLLHRPGEEHETGQCLDYTRGYEPAGGDKYSTAWYTIVKGRKFPSEDYGESEPHTPEELSLFFYENMQGTGRDKRQKPELDANGNPTGAVEDSELLKDEKPCGTYIEVKAFYRSRDGVVSNGDIVYRFMLGKDVISDYNAERNYHYKLTLHFNGKANDYDWHIDYNEEPGIKVPIPYYYVPYMYNQSMVYPVTIIGDIEGPLEATIIRSDWGPSTIENPGEPVAGFEYYNKRKPVDDGPWHGFLSLRQAPPEPGTDRGRKVSVGTGTSKEYIYKDYYNGVLYNRAYWEGNGDPAINEKVNARGHRFYNVDGSAITGRSDNANDDFAADGSYEVKTTMVNGKRQTTFLIPLYSREINLIKTSGYRGNNPYMAYYRYAEIEFKAKIDGKVQTTVAKVLQVPRIVNPKGIYRSWNCTDPFNVHLMRMDSENNAETMNYVPVTSFGGPWSAEIEYISDGGGWLAIDGKTRTGDKIYGYTDSEIQFDVTFKSTTGDKDKVRSAIIKVLYNNYTCTHRIMVRQGYAPVAMTRTGATKWHTSNVQYVEDNNGSYIAHEWAYPRAEGSMFRSGNLTQAIASVNNQLNDRYEGQDSYYLAPYIPSASEHSKASWDDIKSNRSEAFKDKTFEVTNNLDVTSDKGGRLPTTADYEDLRKECEFGAGILYGDGATETQTNPAYAHGYATYLIEGDDRQSRGMRGWFVYNPNEAMGGINLFFPIGVAGNGRRKHGVKGASTAYYIEKTKGVLRYANRAGLMPDGTGNFAEYRPLLYAMYTQLGAIYWTQGREANKTAWDINYSTFDFNTFNAEATTLFDDSDAGFIRLVED